MVHRRLLVLSGCSTLLATRVFLIPLAVHPQILGVRAPVWQRWLGTYPLWVVDFADTLGPPTPGSVTYQLRTALLTAALLAHLDHDGTRTYVRTAGTATCQEEPSVHVSTVVGNCAPPGMDVDESASASEPANMHATATTTALGDVGAGAAVVAGSGPSNTANSTTQSSCCEGGVLPVSQENLCAAVVVKEPDAVSWLENQTKSLIADFRTAFPDSGALDASNTMTGADVLWERVFAATKLVHDFLFCYLGEGFVQRTFLQWK